MCTCVYAAEGCQQVARRAGRDGPKFADRPPPTAVLIAERRPQNTRTGDVRGRYALHKTRAHTHAHTRGLAAAHARDKRNGGTRSRSARRRTTTVFRPQ